jgi:hypothetical protein
MRQKSEPTATLARGASIVDLMIAFADAHSR